MNQKGITNITLVVLMMVVAGTVGYFGFFKMSQPVVQRPLAIQTTSPASIKNETENWEVYRSENYGIEFKHPLGWYVADGTGGGGQISIYNKKPPNHNPHSGMGIYRYKNETADIKIFVEQMTPNYSTNSDADIALLKKEQRYVIVAQTSSYRVYTKIIDRIGPMECYNPPCDWSAYKNVESLDVSTYIPHKSAVFAVSVNMQGKRGPDEEKKKIDSTEEVNYLNIYEQILSTIKFLN